MATTILAIESSCDDTAAAVVRDGVVLSNMMASQDVHRQYGGVVPELASRAHQMHIVPVVDAALRSAQVSRSELDAVAFTRGPGLIGSLMVGVSFAKGLALGLGIPLIDVHHLQAHVLAHFAGELRPSFPFLCLIVSGGHTQIMLVKDYLDMEVVGQTLDDAAGEAFDKTGKMLGLGYPAGPGIDRHAREGTARFNFPEPAIPGLDFSFSGLKTAILYFLRKQLQQDPRFLETNLNDLCASIQERIASILMHKIILASDRYQIKQIAIAGGVAANSGLRAAIAREGAARGWKTFIPPMEYCTDNAAMIGIAGHYKFLRKAFAEQDAAPVARWAM